MTENVLHFVKIVALWLVAGIGCGFIIASVDSLRKVMKTWNGVDGVVTVVVLELGMCMVVFAACVAWGYLK